jgi:predicted ATPase/DNA-binding CsgD family transcriptional regulator
MRSAGNLPAHLVPLFGREQLIREIRERLLQTPRGLLTLIGAGGIGKTCLALQVAGGLHDQFPDGVWLVELAALRQPTLLPKVVASALGLRERPARSTADMLLQYVGSQQLLLVMDNCEHLVDACAELVETLLSHCPDLTVLATSREALRIEREMTWRVPSLGAPDPTHLPTSLQELHSYPAVALFVDRAQANRPEFRLTLDSARSIAQICARLDGMPLPIELAAPRVAVLSLEQIAARLDDAFDLLVRGSRAGPSRHETMRATLDWSYDLLTLDERCLFRRLSVFAGRFNLRDAEVVGRGEVLDAQRNLDILQQLIEKSLVLSEECDGEAWYRLLEPIRQYAGARLADHGEREPSRRRHAEWYLSLAQELDRAIRGPDQVHWLSFMEREHGNFRAALRWCLEAKDGDTALRLGTALWLFWRLRGHRQEGARWLDEALAQSAGATSEVRAAALQWCAELDYVQANFVRARERFEEARLLWRALGNTRNEATTLCYLGRLLGRTGEYESAIRLLHESLSLSQQVNDCWAFGFTLMYVAAQEREHGHLDAAITAARECAAQYPPGTDEHMRGHAVQILGNLLREQGDAETAERLQQECMPVLRKVGCDEGTAAALLCLSQLALSRGDLSQAASMCSEALRLEHHLDLRADLATSLELMAELAIANREPAHGARLLGAAAGLRESIQMPVPPADVHRLAGLHTQARTGMGASNFKRAYLQGKGAQLEEVINDACTGGLMAARVRSASPSTLPISRREQAVAALVAQGYSNRRIAEALVISERTADGHVARILSKLGLNTRAQIAVWAVNHGLVASRDGA